MRSGGPEFLAQAKMSAEAAKIVDRAGNALGKYKLAVGKAKNEWFAIKVYLAEHILPYLTAAAKRMTAFLAKLMAGKLELGRWGPAVKAIIHWARTKGLAAIKAVWTLGRQVVASLATTALKFWQKVRAPLAKSWAAIKPIIPMVWRVLSEAVGIVLQAIDALAPFFASLFRALATVLKPALLLVRKVVGWLWPIVEWMAQKILLPLLRRITTVLSWVVETYAKFQAKIADFVLWFIGKLEAIWNTLRAIPEYLKKAFVGLKDAIVGLFKAAWEALPEWIRVPLKYGVGTLKESIHAVKEWASDQAGAPTVAQTLKTAMETSWTGKLRLTITHEYKNGEWRPVSTKVEGGQGPVWIDSLVNVYGRAG